MRRHLLALLAPLALGACTGTTGDKVPELDYSIDQPWPSRQELPPLGGGRIVITNSYDDTVSLLDLDSMGSPTWGELARVPVGLNPVELEGPHHAAFSPRGDYYYVGLSYSVPGGSGPHGSHGTGTQDGYALKLDARDNRLVGSVRVDRNPGDLIITSDGRTLLQTHFDIKKIEEVAKRGGPESDMDARLAILDAETMTRRAMVRVCPAPHAVRLSPDETRAYVACLSDEVAVVRLDQEGYPVTRLKVPGAGTTLSPRHEPYALTVSPTDGSVWVASLKSRVLHYLDPESLTMRAERGVFPTNSLVGAPMFGTFSADGRTLYQPYQRLDSVALIDPATSQVKGEIALAPSGCVNVHQVELTPDGQHLLAVCEGDHVGPGSLHVVELATSSVVKTVTLGLFPDSVGILRRKP